ncbi:MAG: type VI secretion system baseplate subunit TssG [Treponema sp.]|jgi:type VI secretion system ImpH/TssG family protein|nr:type VI secretion system baseplate subunit TssG [Treponema sp.]
MENDIGKRIKFLSRNIKGNNSAPGWFGLVRSLEKARPELPRLGTAVHPKNENVRFGQIPSLRFPPSEIADIAEGRSAGVDAAILVHFFGLLGVNGPMPLDFTHYVFRRSNNHFDHTWRRFLDIIHHRFLTLFYRAFARNEQSVSFDREDDDPIRGIFKSLAGLPPDQVFKEPRQERVLLAYPHQFGIKIKNRVILEDILRRSFRMDITVKDLVLASYDIPLENRAVLGRRKTATLGVNLQIGRTYYSARGKFEIHIGPVDYQVCRRLLPGESGFVRLEEIIKLYLARPLDYDLIFTISGDSIPRPALGGPAAYLGGCWIGQVPGRLVRLVKHIYAYGH